jgi:hypothetical protein
VFTLILVTTFLCSTYHSLYWCDFESEFTTSCYQEPKFFFCGGRGLNPVPCIFYVFSIPTELSSHVRSKTVSVHLAKSQEISAHTSLIVSQWWFPSHFTRVSLRFNPGSLYQLLEHQLVLCASIIAYMNKLFLARWFYNRNNKTKARKWMNDNWKWCECNSYMSFTIQKPLYRHISHLLVEQAI